MMKKRNWLVLLAAAFLFAACGDEHGHNDDVHHDDGPTLAELVAEVNEEACLHLANGPFETATAVTSPTGAEPVIAPAVDTDHHAYQIELPVDERGYAKFQSPEAMDYVIFMDLDLHFHMREWDSAGDRHTVALEDSQTSIPECELVKARHQVELGIGTYYLDFGTGFEGQTVTVAIEPFDAEGQGHGHDDDGHGSFEDDGHGHAHD